MSPGDLAGVHARAFAEAGAWGGRAWSAAEFAALLARPEALVAGDARAFVLGRVVVDEAEVLTLATDPAHRRRGLARAALAAFEAQAAARGAGAVFLEVAESNAAAVALYRAAGYAEAGRRAGYYRGPEGPVAALVLRRALAPGG